MKVRNMQSNNGNTIANQFIIEGNNTIVFQSYNSVIVRLTDISGNGSFTKVELDSKYWDYSKTTGKYRNQFLNETKAETQRKIDSGEYILTNLN